MVRRAQRLNWWWIAAIVLVAAACTAAQDTVRSPDDDAGAAPSVVPANPVPSTIPLGPIEPNAFQGQVSGLTPGEVEIADVGNVFFLTRWDPFPGPGELQDGLGPTFNANSCASCHLNNGRGEGPIGPDDRIAVGLFARLSIPGVDADGGPVPHPVYGRQIQTRALRGVEPEGRLSVTYETVEGEYGDGTPYRLQRPVYELKELAFGEVGDDVLIGPRLAQQIIGMGFLEAVPEETVRAMADPDDADGDGISGRVNEVWNPRTERAELGRFGWKANDATIEAQVAAALRGDIGINSALRPETTCTEAQTACREVRSQAEPEVSEEVLAAITLFTQTRAVPAPRAQDDPGVIRGAQLFESFGCASCHSPTLETGDHPIAALSGQTIHPFTDLLLHDMGEGLADGRPDFLASGSEWRTAPLWGLGRLNEVGRRDFLLHDGRARNAAEAILWHGGEASAAMEAFRTAPAEDRAALLRYLESL